LIINNTQLPAQRPLHTLPDQLSVMILTPNQAGANAGAGGLAGETNSVQGIPHRHCHVAQPAFVADAANRAAFGDTQKVDFGSVEQGHELLAGQAGAFVKIGQGAALPAASAVT
jgi:hypothetical protein